MEETEHEEREIAELEHNLLQAEYGYKLDIGLLQEALLRMKRLENLHLLGIHLKIQPLLRNLRKLPLQRLYYKWKSRCNIDGTYRYRKLWKLLRYLLIKNLTKAFVLFRERGNRMHMEKLFNPGSRIYND